MSSVRKYVLKPFESEPKNEQELVQRVDHNYAKLPVENNEPKMLQTKPAKNAIKERARIKMENILKIITSVAMVNGYDSQRRIRSSSGKYLTDTDIVELLMHAMQPGKVLRGEDEFVNLLRDAKVDPDWLLNENVKSKLKTYTRYETSVESPKVIKQSEGAPMHVERTSPIQAKRKNLEDSDEKVDNKKRKLNWDYSDDE